MRQILRISRPTKLELIRLRRRLAIARRIHRILRDRLTLLVQELFVVIRKIVKARRELNDLLSRCYAGYTRALAVHGYDGLATISSPLGRGIEVYAGTRNVAGVRAPIMEIAEIRTDRWSYIPPELLPCIEVRDKVIELIIRIAELEKELQRIGQEFDRTKRRVNMLEYVLIPRLMNTIRYLRMKFEEREREEKVRLKRIKYVLARRRGS